MYAQSRRPHADRRNRRRGAAAVAILVLVAAVTACGGAAKKPAQAQWLLHRDVLNGFTIEYPAAWNVYVPPSGAQFLAGPDDTDFAEVRVISGIGVTFQNGTADAAAEQQLIRQELVGQKITVASCKQVAYGGLNGWEYDYGFQDQSRGTGVHFHVFLFQGDRIHTIVLQALPVSRANGLAQDFARILNTYKALPVASTGSPAPTLPPSSPTPTPSGPVSC